MIGKPGELPKSKNRIEDIPEEIDLGFASGIEEADEDESETDWENVDLGKLTGLFAKYESLRKEKDSEGRLDIFSRALNQVIPGLDAKTTNFIKMSFISIENSLRQGIRPKGLLPVSRVFQMLRRAIQLLEEM